MPAKSKRSTCFGSSPRLFTNGSAFGSRLTKIRLNHCSARTGASAKWSGREVSLALELGSADQRAVQPVGPTVVAAAEELAGTAAFSGRSGAMAANIVKTAQLATGAAHQQQGLAVKFGGEEIARIRQLMAMAYHLPGLAEDLLVLQCQDRRIGIKRSRKRPSPPMSGSMCRDSTESWS